MRGLHFVETRTADENCDDRRERDATALVLRALALHALAFHALTLPPLHAQPPGLYLTVGCVD